MSRSDYTDDGEAVNLWRGAVASALRGSRGQAFLREMLASLDALPEKKLIAADLVSPAGEVCALGAVGKSRSLPMETVVPEDYESVARLFGIAEAMQREIVFLNDEGGPYDETPDARWRRMRNWVVRNIREDATAIGTATDGGVMSND